MAAGIVSVFMRHQIGNTPETLVDALPSGVDIVLDNVHHESAKHGVRQWALDAESAVCLNAEKKILFDGISATFFIEDGGTLLLTGKKGALNTGNENIDITGDVVITGKGYELRTESLSYLHQEGMIVSAVPVLISGERLRLSGCGMQFDLNSGRLGLKEQVEMVYGVSGKKN